MKLFYWLYFNLECFLGRSRFWRWFQRRFASYGTIIKAEKCVATDYDKVQIKDFQDRTGDFKSEQPWQL